MDGQGFLAFNTMTALLKIYSQNLLIHTLKHTRAESLMNLHRGIKDIPGNGIRLYTHGSHLSAFSALSA